MKAFSRAGHPDEVLRLLREMKESGCKPNLLCYTTAIHSLVISNRPCDAQALFQEMLMNGVQPDAASFTILVKLFPFHLKHFDSACIFLGCMVKSGSNPDVVTYSTLIAGLCRAGLVDDAWRMFEKMLEWKCTPNAHTYTPIIQLYCSRGGIRLARRILDHMHDDGIPPDAVAYNVFVQALCQARKFEQVETLLRESDEKGWKPDGVTYNTYINGLCKAGRVEAAFDQLEAMLDKGLQPTSVTLSILLNSLCKESKVVQVMWLLERSSLLGWFIGTDGYNTMMSRLCESGQWVAALKLFADMVKKGVCPDTQSFNIVINSLCKGGKLGIAGNACLEAGSFIADSVTYNILYCAFQTAGRIDEFHDLFSNMDVSLDTVTYNIEIDYLCRKGRYSEAVYFLRSLEDRFSPVVVAHLTHGLVKGGKLGEVLSLFRDMLSRGLVIDYCIFDSLIRAFCQKGSCGSMRIYKLGVILDIMLQIS
ncbi:hypothetical protein J5N97_016323 [Dioscorea zingiberensis]|uniref:Pentatricopeptide repeat-containing protein n=1 Tax=Dioscorea zingiberensis TaxID=325984 RepID=A0A9D5HFI7_9LILI|nr:hypothetical protein J5N97_016323 [Dioscorea zingiberensis]